jgi:hypothetical protein
VVQSNEVLASEATMDLIKEEADAMLILFSFLCSLNHPQPLAQSFF